LVHEYPVSFSGSRSRSLTLRIIIAVIPDIVTARFGMADRRGIIFGDRVPGMLQRYAQRLKPEVLIPSRSQSGF